VTRAYAVFGGVLRSELEIEELPAAPADAVPTWRLEVVGDVGPPAGVPLGSDVVYGDCIVRGFRSESAWSLVFDDTGRFDVSSDGSRITWFRPPDASLHSAVADITSRVLAMALHVGGIFTLHASAVSLPGGAIAFLAPKHFGKSTLCGALVQAGGLAISDDTVPVRLEPTAMLSPGLPRLRLWSDAAGRIFGVGDNAEAPRKHLIDELTTARIEARSVPFRAAYVLDPVRELAGGIPVEREPMDVVAATMAVLRHAKLGPILSGAESRELLARSGAVASAVPVYSLRVVRDLQRVDDVAATILTWHGKPAG
jgi:hypothetical protein